MADVSVLEVLLYDEPIGTLTRVSGDRTLFAFEDAYIEDINRSVLGLGFKDQLGELITEFKPTRTRVLPFFSNVLPEGPMRTYLAERAGVDPVREFSLLWVLGRDLPGAITIRPADGEAWPPGAHDDADGAHDDDRRENALRFSLAGVQLKFSSIMETSGGLTIPAEGVGGLWIVKLPSREFAGVPENEYSMMTLARLIGMDVPAVQLVDIDAIKNLPTGIGALQGQVLAIERFDRLPGGGAVHTEDFAQIFGIYPDDKYKKASHRNIAQVIAVEGGEADIAEFTRRVTFNALIGNADMHPIGIWCEVFHGEMGRTRRHSAYVPASRTAKHHLE